MAWYIKYYRHEECQTIWTDEWSCACNDHCPKCNAEIEPYDWKDLSLLIEEDQAGWLVKVSPPSASNSPDYEKNFFEKKRAAQLFAAKKRKQILELEIMVN